jgi:hypothetical protein
MRIAEVFGHDVSEHSEEAWSNRSKRHCRFRDSTCTKSSKTDPLGICTLADGPDAAALCPVRFLEGNRIFLDAARIAFGEVSSLGVFPEIRILEIPSARGEGKTTKIGKVDFLIGKIESGMVTDFAAVEIQAAYFSSDSIRQVFNEYLSKRSIEGLNTKRRPDFRSCAQKRLVPQLQLKIPVFRRWGKKFFVVVDSNFFGSLPTFPETTPSNSEVTWLSYPIRKTGDRFLLSDPRVVFSEWDVVQNSLREGKPPEPDAIVRELQAKLDGPKSKHPLIIDCSS